MHFKTKQKIVRKIQAKKCTWIRKFKLILRGRTSENSVMFNHGTFYFILADACRTFWRCKRKQITLFSTNVTVAPLCHSFCRTNSNPNTRWISVPIRPWRFANGQEIFSQDRSQLTWLNIRAIFSIGSWQKHSSKRMKNHRKNSNKATRTWSKFDIHSARAAVRSCRNRTLT